ncbi:MAG: TIGR03663 family protein, partial [Anaerolineae bacterium]|nr:TIGR03663 family protein [Anaerolineae bacterium]
MATPEQALTIPRQDPETDMEPEMPRADTGILDRAVRRALAIDWEIAFYIVIFALAVTTRLVNLGDRVMSHDESLHTYYSYQLYQRGDYDHTPLMHGPVLFHATALSYFLFGDSDFSARLYPAILGILMVMMPWLLFRRWLGKYGAMAASLFVLISPMLLYHHRYIREDTPAIFFTMLMVYAIFVYVDGVESRRRQPGWLILLAASTLLNLASKETAFMYILIFAAFTGFFLLMQMVQGWRSRLHSASVGWAIVGVVAVPVLGVVGTLVAAAIGIPSMLAQAWRLIDTQIGSTPIVVEFSAETLQLLGTIVVGVPVAIVLGALLAAVGFFVWRVALGRPLTRAIDTLGRYSVSFFKLAMAGILVGAVATLMMINVFAIIQPENIQRAADIWNGYYAQQATAPGAPTVAPPTEPSPQAYILRLLLWSGTMVVGLVGILISTALVKFRGRPSLPWRDIFMVIGIAAIVFAVLIFLEERARLVPNVSSEVRQATVFDNMWVYGPWVVGIL